jgi:hypothetical protein
MNAGATITASTSFGFGQYFVLLPHYMGMSRHHHLGYTFTVVHGKRLLRQIYQQNFYLASIVGIYCSGAIEHREAMLKSQTAAGSYLRLIARRQFNEKPCWNKRPLQWCQHNRLV